MVVCGLVGGLLLVVGFRVATCLCGYLLFVWFAVCWFAGELCWSGCGHSFVLGFMVCWFVLVLVRFAGCICVYLVFYFVVV